MAELTSCNISSVYFLYRLTGALDNNPGEILFWSVEVGVSGDINPGGEDEVN